MCSSISKRIEYECLVFFVSAAADVNLVVKNLTTKGTRKSTIGHN